MTEEEILEIFNLKPVKDEAILKQVYGVKKVSEMTSEEQLKCWLSLLPDNISSMIQLALRQDRPFLPPGVTPEMMATTNENLPSMNHIEILTRCIAMAVSSKDLVTAGALVYVVDRAVYRFGDSRALLKIVDLILDHGPTTPLAPQVVIRKARVMKDDGDLHGAIRVLDKVISKESVWDYKDEGQYNNVKAVCVQIKGQILQYLGLWKDAIEPLVESVEAFNKLGDDKGTSSSLGLLTRCLKRLTQADYLEMKQRFPVIFAQSHPCFEAYIQGMEAVKYIADLGQTLYTARHQLLAEESLLMFALQQPPSLRGFQWFQRIVTDIKETLKTHKTVSNLRSAETFYEFIRAIFLIHLTLYFSPVPQDRALSKYLEQISIELYRHLSAAVSRRRLVTTLDHNRNSVSFMNATLGILGLPSLQGSSDSESVVAEDGSATDVEDGSAKDLEKVVGKKELKVKPLNKAATVPAKDTPDGKNQSPGTFPGALKINKGQTSDKVYLMKYVGLPVDGSSFSVTSLTQSRSESSNNVSSDESSDVDLVNLSVASVSETAEKLDKLHLDSSDSFSFGKDLSKSKTSTSTEKSSSISTDSSSGQSSSFEMITDPNKKSVSTDSSGSSSASSSGQSNSFGKSSDSSKPSSSGESSSFVDLSAPTLDSYSWCQVTEEMGELSPLVDLSCSTVNSSFESLQFGQSVETESPVEYLEHWEPPLVDETIKVYKGLLLTYNPVNGEWVSQSSLVHVGRELDLGSNRKGNCRDVFEVFFLHQDEPLARYVCKRYRHQRPARYYQQDVVCQMMAGYYVTRFNQALRNYHTDIQVQFLPAAHLQLLSPSGHLEDWVNVEPYLHGDFIKLTNNLAFSNKKEKKGEELATALTHFSYCESQGILMIVDIQGWLPRDGKGVIYLTDPQFHTREIKRFSPADRQEEGMRLFWTKVHPTCNSICTALDLARPE